MLMKIDVSKEIVFSTARSGGSGGQNVNKVETMVEGRWSPLDSQFFSEEQKEQLALKLSGKITSEGFLLVKSQTHRSQLGNRHEVINKMNALIQQSLIKKKARISTKPSRASKENRILGKKIKSQIKEGRKKVNF